MATFLLLSSLATTAQTANVFMVPPASNTLQQGFIRFTNPNQTPVDVIVTGIDDEGNRGATDITFSIPARASQQMNSNDIEFGNGAKGLTGFFGSGVGNWRLAVSSTQSIGVTAYVRTVEGFMTKIGGIVPNIGSTSHVVPMFNPASNLNQVSKLRLVNTSTSTNNITIVGIDDNGTTSATNATLTLAPEASIIISAQEIENGSAVVQGGIGDGVGKWQLFVTTSQTAAVMNLLEAPGGYISNLSKAGN